MSGDEKRLAMKNRHVRARCALGCAALVILSLDWDLSAQQAAQTPPPRTTPRAADGRPDLTGVWVAGSASSRTPSVDSKGSIQVYLALPGLNPDSPNVFKEMDSVAVKLRAANPNKPVYKPELLSKVKELSDLQAKLDPAFFCKLPGVPRMGPPAQIVQSTGLVVLLYGDQNAFRVVPTDGRHTERMWSLRTSATRLGRGRETRSWSKPISSSTIRGSAATATSTRPRCVWSSASSASATHCGTPRRSMTLRFWPNPGTCQPVR